MIGRRGVIGRLRRPAGSGRWVLRWTCAAADPLPARPAAVLRAPLRASEPARSRPRLHARCRASAARERRELTALRASAMLDMSDNKPRQLFAVTAVGAARVRRVATRGCLAAVLAGALPASLPPPPPAAASAPAQTTGSERPAREGRSRSAPSDDLSCLGLVDRDIAVLRDDPELRAQMVAACRATATMKYADEKPFPFSVVGHCGRSRRRDRLGRRPQLVLLRQARYRRAMVLAGLVVVVVRMKRSGPT
jgi:hypothetical protein